MREIVEAISEHDRAAGRLDLPDAAGSGGVPHEPAPTPARPPLGSLLTGGGYITETQLADALAEGTATGQRLGEVVVLRGWVSEDDVAKLLAEQWQLGYVDRASIFFDAEALARLSRAQAQSLEALPTRVQDGRVVVAVAEPTEQRLTALRAVIGDDTVVVVVPKTALDAGLRSDLLSGGANGEDAGSTPEERPEAVAAVPPADPPDPEPPAAAPPTSSPPPSRAGAGDEPQLENILAALGSAAAKATSLQQQAAELARTLATISEQVDTMATRLADSEDHGTRVVQLEEELAQRTEMTEALKAQLLGLSRTLEQYP